MDRAEARNRLRWLKVTAPTTMDREALDLAIEALKEPTGDYEFFGGTYAKEGDAESATTTDCISRQAAIEAVRGCKFHAIKGSLQTAPWYEAINEVLEILSALPQVTPPERAGEWIPVSERLPSENDNYLCTIPLDAYETYTEVLTFHKGRFYEDDDEWGATYHDDVIAWMPLPEPYKGGDTE